MASDGTSPCDDAYASAWYRREVLPVHLAAFSRRKGESCGENRGQFTLNGAEQNEFVESGTTLLTVLRDKLGLTATKSGCNQGTCGACTVLIDGAPQLSCLTLAERCDGQVGRRRSKAFRRMANFIRCSAPSWTVSRRNAASARRA